MTQFTLKVKNNGPRPAPNARVVFSGLEDMTVVGSTPSQGTFDNTVWSIGLVEVGSEATIEVEVMLPEDVESALVHAVVSSGVADHNLSNNVIEIIVDASSHEPTGIEWYISTRSDINHFNPEDFDEWYYRCDMPSTSFFAGNDMSSRCVMHGAYSLRVSLYPHSKTESYFTQIDLGEYLPSDEAFGMPYQPIIFWDKDRDAFVFSCVFYEDDADGWGGRTFFLIADLIIDTGGYGISLENASYVELHDIYEPRRTIQFSANSDDNLLLVADHASGYSHVYYVDYSDRDDIRTGNHRDFSSGRNFNELAVPIQTSDPNKQHMYLGLTEYDSCGGKIRHKFTVYDFDSMSSVASVEVTHEGYHTYIMVNRALNMNNKGAISTKFGELWGTSNCSMSHICWYDFSQISSLDDLTEDILLEILHIAPLDESFSTMNPRFVCWRADESGIIHSFGNTSRLVGLDGDVSDLPQGVEYSIMLNEPPVSFTDCAVE